jgi:cyclopropane fatty-acyl-phospholipid synthase-like methyltransferase
MTYTETDVGAAIESLTGNGLVALTQLQRDQFDQFHAGGPEAVERLLPGLRLTPDATVVDVGSGFGGPARQIARTVGCRVIGVDVTPAYVEVARALTEAAGLADRVEFTCADIGTLARADFDAAYTMHVQMNVADKKVFYADVAARLRPGGRLAVFEVCRTGHAEPELPLPWSLDGTGSFLVPADELRGSIESCGFAVEEWVDETDWVNRWFEQAPARMAAAGSRATLPALLDAGLARMLNFAAAIGDGVVSVHRGTFTRSV